MKNRSCNTQAHFVKQFFIERFQNVVARKRKENAEYADYPQNTQTGWECGDNANYVGYATIPARLNKFKIAIEHRVIARRSGVNDTWSIASALSARSPRPLRSKN